MPRNANALSNQAAQMAGPCAESAEGKHIEGRLREREQLRNLKTGLRHAIEQLDDGKSRAGESSMLSRSAALPVTNVLP